MTEKFVSLLKNVENFTDCGIFPYFGKIYVTAENVLDC